MKFVLAAAMLTGVAFAPFPGSASAVFSAVSLPSAPDPAVHAPVAGTSADAVEHKQGLGCPTGASAGPTAANERNLTTHVGHYIAEDGGAVVVSLEKGTLKLASGPMTFTLIPCQNGYFGTRERDLLIAFTANAVTVSEQGRVVARAARGEAERTIIAPQGEAFPKWLDINVPSLLARYRVPAAAIAYIADGRVSLTRVYGERRRGEAAGFNTLFNIASLNKPITAEVLLRLASQNRLNLDTPMYTAWVDPDLRGDPRARSLTTRMALQHRAGLPNWRAHTGNVLGFVVELGSTFRYSGEGYTYAARYAERRTSQRFEELARQLVFGPIGMKDTAYTVQPSWKSRAAYPHDAQGRELSPLLRLDFSGACCVHSTIGDYARFVVSVVKDRALTSAIASQRFTLARDQRDEMCVGDGIAVGNCPSRIGMGLGWMVFGYAGETVVTHTGVNEGERAAAFFVPERGMGLVILTNGANGAKLIRDVTAAAYNNPSYLGLVEATAR